MTASITDTGAGPGAHASGPAARAGLMDALSTVRDPELDEPITSLGFVTAAVMSAAGDVQVRLRLPTYFCAPNFALPDGGGRLRRGGRACRGSGTRKWCWKTISPRT